MTAPRVGRYLGPAARQAGPTFTSVKRARAAVPEHSQGLVAPGHSVVHSQVPDRISSRSQKAAWPSRHAHQVPGRPSPHLRKSAQELGCYGHVRLGKGLTVTDHRARVFRCRDRRAGARPRLADAPRPASAESAALPPHPPAPRGPSGSACPGRAPVRVAVWETARRPPPLPPCQPGVPAACTRTPPRPSLPP